MNEDGTPLECTYKGKLKCAEKPLSQCHFVHQNAEFNPGIGGEMPDESPKSWQPGRYKRN